MTPDERKLIKHVKRAKTQHEKQKIVDGYNKLVQAELKKGAEQVIDAMLSSYPHGNIWDDFAPEVKSYKGVLSCGFSQFYLSGNADAFLEANGHVTLTQSEMGSIDVYLKEYLTKLGYGDFDVCFGGGAVELVTNFLAGVKARNDKRSKAKQSSLSLSQSQPTSSRYTCVVGEHTFESRKSKSGLKKSEQTMMKESEVKAGSYVMIALAVLAVLILISVSGPY